MSIHWNDGRVRKYMAKRGVENASQLAAGAGITKPTAGRVLAGARIERLDADVLEALAGFFGLSVGALIIRRPDAQIPDASSSS